MSPSLITSSSHATAHHLLDVEGSAAIRFEGVHQEVELGWVQRHDAAVAPVFTPTVDGETVAPEHEVPGVGDQGGPAPFSTVIRLRPGDRIEPRRQRPAVAVSGSAVPLLETRHIGVVHNPTGDPTRPGGRTPAPAPGKG